MTIQQLRAKIGKDVTGDMSFDGSPNSYMQASDTDRIKITNRMKDYILANPSEFPDQQKIASLPPITSPVNYSFFDGVSDFIGESGNQIVKINDSVNPFSESNRKWVLGVAVLGVAVYLLAPVIINSIRKGE